MTKCHAVHVTIDNSSRARFDRQLRDSAQIAGGVLFVSGLLVVAATLFLAYTSSSDPVEKNTDFSLFTARVLLAAALIVVPGVLVLAFPAVWLRYNPASTAPAAPRSHSRLSVSS